jgi:hypothetical protein
MVEDVGFCSEGRQITSLTMYYCDVERLDLWFEVIPPHRWGGVILHSLLDSDGGARDLLSHFTFAYAATHSAPSSAYSI